MTWRPVPGDRPVGSIGVGSMLDQVMAEHRQSEANRSIRQQAIARVQNMFGVGCGRFTQAQWAYVDAVERMLKGGLGSNRQLPKYGGFSLPPRLGQR